MAGLFWETIERCLKHNTSLLSGALAFYALLSLAPGAVLRGGGGGSGDRPAGGARRGHRLGHADDRLRAEPSFIGGILTRGRIVGSFATIAGVVSLIFGVSGAFGALQDALNLIWEVPPSERGYVKQFFFKRLVSFVAVMIVGVLLLVALLIGAIISAAGKFMPQALPATEFLLQAANFAVSLVLVTVLFAMLYRILPDSWVAWRDVWTGAAITALLFSIGKAADRTVPGAHDHRVRRLARPDPWWCSCCGCITPRRFSCSVRSSPRSTPSPEEAGAPQGLP